MSSLLSNRMFALDTATSMKLLSGEEGCSPALEPVAKFNNLGLSTPGPSGELNSTAEIHQAFYLLVEVFIEKARVKIMISEF